jgi:hypothetical protein
MLRYNWVPYRTVIPGYALARRGACLKFRIYIDEVGNPDLESSEDPNHRFLSLTGVILDLDYVQQIVHPQMENLKGKYFSSHPDEPVVFHRSEMVNGLAPFQSLRDPEVRRNFDDELLRLLDAWDYRVISVCLDKKKHKETYTVWRYDSYHYCLAVLLERFVFFLNRRASRGDALAESRGGKEDRRLKAAYTRLWEHGTDFVGPDQFQRALTSKQLKVKLKTNNVSGLQLADLLAHPSRNEILKDQDLLHKELAPFAQRIVAILRRKYDNWGGQPLGKKFL